MVFATAAELATHLQHNVDNTAATQALTLATARIVRATGQLFTPGTSTVQLEGNESRITLPQRPVTSVALVQVAWPTAFWRTWTVDRDYYVSQSELVAIWYEFPDRVRVTFSYGYAAVPDDVKACCIQLAGEEYENPAGLTSEKIDDYAYTLYDPTTGEGTPGMRLLNEIRGSYGSAAYVSTGT